MKALSSRILERAKKLRFLFKWLIWDEPKEMLACGDCNATDCTNEKFRTCERRIARDRTVGLS